jgi:hypothetical protein
LSLGHFWVIVGLIIASIYMNQTVQYLRKYRAIISALLDCLSIKG